MIIEIFFNYQKQQENKSNEITLISFYFPTMFI